MNKWVFFVFGVLTSLANAFECHQENVEVVKPSNDTWAVIIADTVFPAMKEEYDQGGGLSPDLLIKRQPSNSLYGDGAYVLRIRGSLRTVGVLWSVDKGVFARDVFQASTAYLPQDERLGEEQFQRNPLFAGVRFLSCRVWIRPECRHQKAAAVLMTNYVNYLRERLRQEPWMKHRTAEERRKNEYLGAVTYVDKGNEFGLKLCKKLFQNGFFPYVIAHRPDNAETVAGFYLLTEQAIHVYPGGVWMPRIVEEFFRSQNLFQEAVSALPSSSAPADE